MFIKTPKFAPLIVALLLASASASSQSLQEWVAADCPECPALMTEKTGAFILAHKTKIPILPIVINGTKNALPKHSLNFHGRHSISVEVLDEIPYKSYSHLSVEETADFIRSKIIEHVDEHRAAYQDRNGMTARGG